MSRVVKRLNGEGWEVVEIPGGEGAVLAVPARRVVAVALLGESLENEMVRTSVELELEVRGLLPRKGHSGAISSRFLALEGRTLAVCAVFPEEFDTEEVFSAYEASPWLVVPPEDGVMLWREGADLVAAFARGKDVVFWATLDWPANSLRVTRWLETLSMSLAASEICPTPRRVVVESSLAGEFSSDLLPGVPQEAGELTPGDEAARFEWKPEAARARDRRSLALRKTLRLGLALAAAYVLAALVTGGYFGMLLREADQLRDEIGRLEAATDEFQPVIRAWRLLGPGAEPEFFPLEILYQTAQKLPAAGVRLTLYDVDAGRVTIEGEASSASLASRFFAEVSADESLRRLRWQMASPVLLPNSAARFQMTGVMP